MKDQEKLAATTVIEGYGVGRAVLMEAVSTFILVFVVFGTAADRHGARATSALVRESECI